MFQTTGTIYPNAAPRTAEQGDTRMALQRREDDQRRQGGGKRRHQGTLTNDEAHVSVEALQIFLTNLVRASEARQERDLAMSAQGIIVEDATLKTGAAANFASPSAQAARAYASASRTAGRRLPSMESAVITQENPLAQAGKPRLTAQEKQQIEALQENLAALSALGVHDLTIERGETFLGSLAGSAEAALAAARGD